MNAHSLSSSLKTAVIAIIGLALPAAESRASVLYYNDAANWNWDTSSAIWSSVSGGPADSVWANGNDATITVSTTGTTVALGDNIIADTLTANGAGRTVTFSGNSLTINSTLAGSSAVKMSSALSGSFAMTGSVSLTFQGSTAYTGTITQEGTGYILLSGVSVSGTGSNFVIDNGYLQTTATSFTMGNLSGTGGFIYGSGSGNGSKLTVTQSASGTYSGNITDNGSHAFSFAKAGSATLTLAGANTYTGTTSVSEGKLDITGSLGNTATTVSSGATLMGTGTIGGVTTVGSGGILVAGDGATAESGLTFTNGLTLSSGSTLEFVLGSGNAHSTLTLSSSAANLFASALSLTFINVQAGTYDDIIAGLASDPGNVGTWTITNTGYSADFSYDGSGHIDVTIAAVPEPSTWVLLVAGLFVVVHFRRRRASV